MARIEEFTDEDIKKALIEANGQPTKAAEILGMNYPHLYTRIRKNPELLEIQKAHRAKVFNDVSNSMVVMAMAGIIKEPLTNENGEVIKGKFREVPVDYKTRLTAMQSVANMFKSDEGITEQIEITTKGSINIADWLKLNNQNKETED